LGIQGARTRQAERLLCLAGASWSYAQGSKYLRELTGLKVAANTVRSVCQREAPVIEEWQSNAPAASESYRQAPGHAEFQTDGTCVNTTEGWKEMRVGVFAKRVPGEPATPDQWNSRKLPRPNSRVAFAAIEDHNTFAARWPRTAQRLGLRLNGPLDVLADGAKWIWERVEFHFAQAQGTLDIYHASEHLAKTAGTLYGEGSAATTRWHEQARDTLLSEGWTGIERMIDQARPMAVRAGQRAALDQLAGYLRPHADRLQYGQRLAEGRSIGSGLIEGACKNFIGRRLKQTGARWLIPNANRMATLGALVYADQWDAYWENSH
jgi:hypothetical protein